VSIRRSKSGNVAEEGTIKKEEEYERKLPTLTKQNEDNTDKNQKNKLSN
jgi:hypothetical protein